MDQGIQQKINQWISGNYEQSVKDEILRLQKDYPDDLADAFYKNLEFGTGGLRGVMGVGTNRINKYTIGMATQGYAYYLKNVLAITYKLRLHMIVETIVVFLQKLLPAFLLLMELKYFYLKHFDLLLN